MNIVFFVKDFLPTSLRSDIIYLGELTHKLISLDHDISIYCPNDPTGSLPTRELWRGIEISRPLSLESKHIFPAFITEKDVLTTSIKQVFDALSWNILAASSLVHIRIAKEEFKYDVVSVHDWFPSIAGLIIKKEMKEALQMIFHVHSTEQQRSGNAGSEFIMNIERKIAEEADEIIAPSQAMKDHLFAIGYPREKIRVCYYGCNPDLYDPSKVDTNQREELRSELGILPDEKIILFTGELVWNSGIQYLLQAFQSLASKLDTNVRLISIGEGELFPELISLSQRLGINDKIIFRPNLTSLKDRVLHYAIADVCVFPSLSEPTGFVALEAMAMMKPLVVGVNGINSFKEIVIPKGANQCGLFVNSIMPTDIAKAVIEVFENKEKANEWGKNGRKRVLDNFTWDITAKMTIAFYEEITQVVKR